MAVTRVHAGVRGRTYAPAPSSAGAWTRRATGPCCPWLAACAVALGGRATWHVTHAGSLQYRSGTAGATGWFMVVMGVPGRHTWRDRWWSWGCGEAHIEGERWRGHLSLSRARSLSLSLSLFLTFFLSLSLPPPPRACASTLSVSHFLSPPPPPRIYHVCVCIYIHIYIYIYIPSSLEEV